MTAMTPFQAARTFLAIKMHFTTDSYDAIKYQGKVKMTREAFEKRKDKYRLEKLARNMTDEEIVNFFVANFTQKLSYSGLWDDQSEARYKEWKKYRTGLMYNFKGEVKRMYEYAIENGMTFEQVFENPHGHPLVLLAYMGKEISLDTFVILDRLYNFVGKLDDNVVTRDLIRLSKKYSPFLRVDLDTYGNAARTIREQSFG